MSGLCGCGGMVDAADSKSAPGDRVGVQVPSAVPPRQRQIYGIWIYIFIINGMGKGGL